MQPQSITQHGHNQLRSTGQPRAVPISAKLKHVKRIDFERPTKTKNQTKTKPNQSGTVPAPVPGPVLDWSEQRCGPALSREIHKSAFWPGRANLVTERRPMHLEIGRKWKKDAVIKESAAEACRGLQSGPSITCIICFWGVGSGSAGLGLQVCGLALVMQVMHHSASCCSLDSKVNLAEPMPMPRQRTVLANRK